MKNKLEITLTSMIVLVFFCCQGRAKEENINSEFSDYLNLNRVQDKYLIDTQETHLMWKGSSLKGSHSGYVYISKGELVIENSNLVGGSVEIDMKTIQDGGHRNDNNLIIHLKSPDFFDVKKFPISKMKITEVTSISEGNKKITGDLTIKGITHPVTFPAKIEIKDSIVKMEAGLAIDRTKWDVRYNSGKFYDNLADRVISDSIVFQIKIIAKT